MICYDVCKKIYRILTFALSHHLFLDQMHKVKVLSLKLRMLWPFESWLKYFFKSRFITFITNKQNFGGNGKNGRKKLTKPPKVLSAQDSLKIL